MTDEKNIPQISVIIPMYNIDEYIGECLDSLLCQTFQDFEVIIVDDCSTDNSRAVVNEYLSKFNGRLRLVESEKNSGGCSVPRNIGMTYATGKYIFFLDGDDLIVKTAFEQLYNVAEEFDADVVQCEKFLASNTSDLKGAELKIKTFKRDGFVKVPTLETDDLRQRVIEFHAGRYVVTVWSKLLRRSFMVDNNITIPHSWNNEDFVFTICCLSCAKNFVKYPNPVNIYRHRDNSIVHRKSDLVSYVRRWIKAFSAGFSECDKFLSSLDFYKQNPEMKYLALDTITQDTFYRLSKVYRNYSPALLDEIIRDEFNKNGNNPAITSFLFNMSIMYSIQIGTYLLNREKK